MKPVAVLLCLSSLATAAPPGGFTADLSNGALVQVGGDDNVRTHDPSYLFSLRAGWDFHIHKLIGVGPELGFDASAFQADSATFGNVPSRFARVKGLVGGRMTIHFDFPGSSADPKYKPGGFFFVRVLFGVDHVEGNFGNGPLTLSASSTGFAFVPETGVLFRVWRMIHAGLTLGFPIATFDYSTPTVTVRSFTAADFTISATLAVHL